ncbi:MAG TPA: FumA C-terminus/TtdB family hydratase beta subunit [Bacillota bacterium]|nr:FumA C-terminus/TtdB family hydratase beta subunit [Bacillota bacterium]HOH09829.1 FumA C-terminus/TtdB family hydratase beta subunit [Bacillota bacterium]HOS50335.1 FumA C-terminus/TtdB family hydratase beta subunit [Bacillota bacterium]HOY89187.1 FumA C-terminus/TtdB family hydratase beta subunit [Bacillota bacterium]HPI00758.1 FumA C-terminus/TtdB family hydratase beta subunit [Bacillota bacterium]
MAEYRLTVPLTEEDVRKLHVGDIVYLTGEVFTARDMAHLRARSLLEKGEPVPEPPMREGGVLFHAGPVMVKEGGVWKLMAIGPTTSMRMEPHCDIIPKLGVRVLVGKGGMGQSSLSTFKDWGAVYLAAAPGCAVKHAGAFISLKFVGWLDMGIPEAVWDFEVADWGPLVVAMDSHGLSIYDMIMEKARKILGY